MKRGWPKGKTHSNETRRKISKTLTGRRLSKEHKRNLSVIMKGNKIALGYKHSEEQNKIKSIYMKRYYKNHPERRKIQSELGMGEKAPNWQGGKTKLSKRIRGSLEYRIWREAVYKRDNYTCVLCGNKESGNLNADHIKPFAYYPKLRFDINNGRTLCKGCHEKTETFGWRYYWIAKKNAAEAAGL